jgi:hypothetical protein
MLKTDKEKYTEVFTLDQAELDKEVPYPEEQAAQRVKFQPVPCPFGQPKEGGFMNDVYDPDSMLSEVLRCVPSYEAGRYSLDNDWDLLRLKQVLNETGPYQLIPVNRKFSVLFWSAH